MCMSDQFMFEYLIYVQEHVTCFQVCHLCLILLYLGVSVPLMWTCWVGMCSLLMWMQCVYVCHICECGCCLCLSHPNTPIMKSLSHLWKSLMDAQKEDFCRTGKKCTTSFEEKQLCKACQICFVLFRISQSCNVLVIFQGIQSRNVAVLVMCTLREN